MFIDYVHDLAANGTPGSSLQVFCDYLTHHMERIPELTIARLAAECGISKGQISKCIRQLGFDDYGDFRLACQDAGSARSNRRQIHCPDSLDYFGQLKKTLPRLETALNEEVCAQFCQLVQQSDTIWLFGRGDGRIAISLLWRGLNETGLQVRTIDPLCLHLPAFRPDDLLLVCSTLGRTFHYDPRIIHRLNAAPVRKLLLTACPQVSLDRSQTIRIPCSEPALAETALLIALDYLLFKLCQQQETNLQS